MNFEAYFLGCLLEGLPIKVVNLLQANPNGLQELAVNNKDLHDCIVDYLSNRDLVRLYKRSARLRYHESSIPAHLKDSSISKLLNELAGRFESMNPSICMLGNQPNLPSICDYLNPLRERETYVLKSDVHYWMYERILQTQTINSLLEIGVFYGGSTHAWRIRLPHCKMYSLDVNLPLQDSRILERARSKFTHGSAIDSSILDLVVGDAPFDLIIDDASHIPSHQIATFIYLINECAASKVYVVEDVHDNSQGGKGFSYFVALLAQYQENTDLSLFLDAVEELLCGETTHLLAKVRNNPKSISNLARIEISRFGDNYTFIL
jgi:hypothetical protein